MTQAVVNIQLTFPAPPSQSLDTTETWLLAGATAYPALHLLAFAAPGVAKAPNVGHLFPNVLPRDDGSFTLELGLQLPELFPNFNAQIEYWLDVADEGDTRRVVFSNQMARVLYRDAGGQTLEVLAARSALKGLLGNTDLNIPADAVHEPLRTVATSRFTVNGNSAEEAVAEHLQACHRRFVALLNRVVDANMMVLPESQPGLRGDYEPNSFPSVFVLMQGRDPDVLGHGKFATNLYANTLNPRNLTEDESKHALAYITGTQQSSDVVKLLHSALNLLHGGSPRHALLQIVVGVEVLTRRYVHAAVLASGTSRKNLKDTEKDLTLSIMLNVLLFSLTPADMKPDRALVGRLNEARKHRNDLMHEGAFSLSREEVKKLHAHAVEYLGYIRKVAARQGLALAA